MERYTGTRGSGSREDTTGRATHKTRGLTGAELVLLTLMALMLVLAAYRAVQPRVGVIGATSTVRVQARQTLWDLASQNPVPGASTSETVELIKAANGMTNSVLLAGQTLRVPCGQDDVTAMASR